MFDTRWENWAGDFGDSFAAESLDPAVRPYATDVLIAFGEAVRAIDAGFPDEVSLGTFAAVLGGPMPRLDLPDAARPHVPEVVASFLGYLRDSGRVGEGDDWAAQVRVIGRSYRERLKPGGAVKGVTIRKSAKSSPLGRNDPCPCGSGKKFKKCCMGQA